MFSATFDLTITVDFPIEANSLEEALIKAKAVREIDLVKDYRKFSDWSPKKLVAIIDPTPAYVEKHIPEDCDDAFDAWSTSKAKKTETSISVKKVKKVKKHRSRFLVGAR